MTVVSAFLAPGSPLPYARRDNPPWGAIADGLERAGEALRASRPDAIVMYSTQWIAVLDQLWQARPRLKGAHVDENWHEYGDLPFNIRVDTDLTAAAIQGTLDMGIKAKGVDYDQFPVDTGTITVSNFFNPEAKIAQVIAANNVYHDWEQTAGLGKVAAAAAKKSRKSIAVVGIGGLSGSFYRHTIDIAEDKIASAAEDEWNRKVLALMERGKADELLALRSEYADAAKVDMGFKHFAFVMGALDNDFEGAITHAYGPLYGAGAAVIEFRKSG